jgi:Uma2 family endonuclease
MSTATKLTYEDYVLMPDDGQRHELIDGELFVVPSPNHPHQRTVLRLGHLLVEWLDANGGGELLVAPFDVIFSPGNVVQPDLLFVAEQNRSRIELGGVKGSPDLVIEVLSTKGKRRDEVTKRDLYQRFAVPEYWIVDPGAETVTIMRLENGVYANAITLRGNDTLTSPTFPGLELALPAIFA